MQELTPALIDMLQKKADLRPFLQYQPQVRDGIVKETKKFTDINGVERSAKYAVVAFAVAKGSPKIINGLPVGCTTDEIAFVELVSELEGQHNAKMINKLSDLISTGEFDKLNLRQDKAGNELFDAKVKWSYMFKFVDVVVPPYYATRWNATEAKNVKLKDKQGDPVINTSVRLMLEEGGEDIGSVYKRTYKRRVQPFLVVATEEVVDIPANTNFDAEKV